MAAKEFPLAVVIRAVDRVTGPLRGVSNAVGRFGTRVRAAGRGISEKLGLPVIGRAASQVGVSLGRLATRVAFVGAAIAAMGAAATAAAFRMVEAFAAAGDEVAKTADRLGIGIERFQELRYAAGQNGIEADKFTMAMTKLNTNVGLAASGTGEAAKVIEGLGLKIRDTEGKVRSVGDLLPELADKFAAIEEPAVAAAAASLLFGERNGSKMLTLLRQGSSGMAELSAEARRLGLIIGEDAARGGEEFGDRMDDLKLSLSGVRNIIGTSLLPRLTELASSLTEMVVANQGRIKQFFDGFAADLPGHIEALIKFLGDLRTAVQPAIDGFAWLVEKFGGANVAMAAIGTVLAVMVVPALYATMSAVYALGVAILATPIGWIIAGIAGIVAGLAWLYDEFEEARIVMDAISAAAIWFFKNMTPLGQLITNWDKVTEAFSATYDALRPLGRAIAWVFMNLTPIGLTIRNWDQFKVGLRQLWSVLQAVGKTVAWVFMNMTPLGYTIRNWDTMKQGIASAWSVLETMGKGVAWFFLNFTPMGLVIKNWDLVKIGIDHTWSALQVLGDGIAWFFMNLTPMGQLIQNWDKVRAAIEMVTAAFSDMREAMSAGIGMAGDWAGGIADKVSGLVPDWARNPFGSEEGERSPLNAEADGQALGARDAARAGRAGQDGEVRVRLDLVGLPKGAKVKTEREGAANFELNQGFAMGQPG